MQLCGVVLIPDLYFNCLCCLIDEQRLLLVARIQIDDEVRHQVDQLTLDTFCVVTASGQDLHWRPAGHLHLRKRTKLPSDMVADSAIP